FQEFLERSTPGWTFTKSLNSGTLLEMFRSTVATVGTFCEFCSCAKASRTTIPGNAFLYRRIMTLLYYNRGNLNVRCDFSGCRKRSNPFRKTRIVVSGFSHQTSFVCR